MECNIVDIPHKFGSKYHLHLYSDIHGEWDRVIPQMRKRAELPNSYFVLLGDNDDWIFPKDPRYLESKKPKELQGVDDYVDAAIEQQYERLKEFRFLFISMGNHDFEMLNRHMTCPTARLARKLGAAYGGYSGFLRIQFRNSKRVRCQFTLLYHHGGSAGAVTKGMPWAQRYSSGWDGWDVFAFGHTHQLWCDYQRRGHMGGNGSLLFRDTWIVNTGTWLETYEQGGSPSYGERKGYKPVALASPMICLEPTRQDKLNVIVTMGNR